MATWTVSEKPKGMNYETCIDGTGKIGEAVEFGYVATLDTGTFVAPDTVEVTLAVDLGDTDNLQFAGTISSDTNSYTVTANLTTAQSLLLSDTYYWEVREGRSGANSYLGGRFYFGPTVE